MKTLTDHLADHYLWQMICDHEAKTDVAMCSCGLWRSEPLPSVGAAARAWAEHAVRSAFLPAPAPRGEEGWVLVPREPTEEDIEALARLIDPSSWSVFDSYLRDVKRKYKGQNAGYDPAAFKDKKSIALTQRLLAVLATRGFVLAAAPKAPLPPPPKGSQTNAD